MQGRASSESSKLLQKYGTEDTIYSIAPASLVSSLYLRSARSYDWAVAPESGFLFSWKPDGERYWCVRYGSMWLFVRRLLSGKVLGWTVCNSLHRAQGTLAILDVEVMIGYPTILLDLLCDSRGAPTTATRSTAYVLDEFRSVSLDGLNVVTKQYFSTIAELKRTQGDLEYPVDGIVGIQENSTDIIKLKETKSLELELRDEGLLATCDGDCIAESGLYAVYEAGSIVEIRVTSAADTASLQVTDVVLRTDKLKANSTSACVDILSTFGLTPDPLSRRRALEWCNTVRLRLYETALVMPGGGRVVLDAGSGDGQALADFPSDGNVTFLLVEPDAERCSKLYRRLNSRHGGRCRLCTSLDTIVKTMSLLSTGSLQYAVVQATLKSVMNVDQFLKSAKVWVRCCVASYSISYMAEDLVELAVNGVPVVGCGYMYDTADSKGILVNASGVKMHRKTETQCVVKWGGDKEYLEPVLLSSNVNKALYVRPATEVVPAKSDKSDALMRQLAANLNVISTRNYDIDFRFFFKKKRGSGSFTLVVELVLCNVAVRDEVRKV